MRNITLKHLDVTIENGELVGIIGPNGSGKSILLKMLCGRFKNDNIFIDGKCINSYDIDYKRNNIVCVFDDNIYKTNKPNFELKYYLSLLGVSEKEIDTRMDYFIHYFKLENIIDKKFIELDIEKRIYIKILSLLIIIPDIMCIDDLFTYLNKDLKMKIFNYIKENNITLISVTSDMEELLLFDKILVMNKGKREAYDLTTNVLRMENVFNDVGLNLPFIYDINNMLKSYELIDRDHLVYKELVDVLWK